MATQQPTATFVPRTPTPAEIADFLKTRTSAQMVELINSVQDRSSQGALMSAFATPTSFTPAISNTTDKAVKPTKPKKALNAFVGFRCYYIGVPEFKAFPMKKLSNMLAEMWNEDTNKPVWALLAKTWSHIRDQIGKENAPLVPYFELMCPAMLLPSPDEYFKTFHWELHLNEQNDPYIVRVSNPSEDTTTKSGATMSVEEIICYCQAHNYAKEFKFNGDLATSSTFHVPLKQGRKTLDQIVNTMESKRLANREKKRLQRIKRINQGTPLDLQLRLAQLRGIGDSPDASTSSSPEPAVLMPSGTMTTQQSFDDIDFTQFLNALQPIPTQAAPAQSFLAAPGTGSIQNFASMGYSVIVPTFTAMPDTLQFGDTVALGDVPITHDAAAMQDITSFTFNSDVHGSSQESIIDGPNNDDQTMLEGWLLNALSKFQGDGTFTMDNQIDNSMSEEQTAAFSELAFRDGADGDATLPEFFGPQF